ncbi:DUF123 domain-containing protein [Halobacteriota archaeon]
MALPWGVGSKDKPTSQIGREFRKEKKLHWHIDYLLARARIKEVYVNKGKECDIVKKKDSYYCLTI